jgi:hypothetical protein
VNLPRQIKPRLEVEQPGLRLSPSSENGRVSGAPQKTFRFASRSSIRAKYGGATRVGRRHKSTLLATDATAGARQGHFFDPK